MNIITRSMNIIDGRGNTRLEPINKFEAHLDYLRFSVKELTVTEFSSLLSFVSAQYDTLPTCPWSPGGGSVWFENKLIGTHGFIGGFDVDDDGLINAMMQLPGSYFEQLNLYKQWELCRVLKHTYKAKCSRIDLAIDDPTYTAIPVENMRKSWAKGRGFGFKKHKYIESGNTPETLQKTWYFGSRESGKLTRIYDHEGECMRHEVEFKRGYAQPVFDSIADIYRPETDLSELIRIDEEKEPYEKGGNFYIHLYRTICNHVVGAIDFRNRGTRKDTGRVGYRDSKRMGFYQQYINKIQCMHVRIPPKKPSKTLSKTVAWVKRQVSATLAMFSAGVGRSRFVTWLRELVMYGDEKLDKLKLLWIEEIKDNPQIVRI